MTKPIQIKNLTIGAGIPENLRSSYWNHQRKNLPGSRGCQKSSCRSGGRRADFFEELMNPEACQNVLEALAEILGETPLLFTIRTSEEGGNITISLEDYAAAI